MSLSGKFEILSGCSKRMCLFIGAQARIRMNMVFVYFSVKSMVMSLTTVSTCGITVTV